MNTVLASGLVVLGAIAQATAANFLKYVDERPYSDGRFHRTVRPDTETNKEHPIEVIQGAVRRGPHLLVIRRSSLSPPVSRA